MSKINDDGFLELSGINVTSKEELSPKVFDILKGLTPLSLRVLNQASRTMTVAKGVQMMHAGDTPHDLYFIAKGSIAITKEIHGQMNLLAKLEAGNIYGEYGALRGKTRFASVHTAETSTIIRVDLKAIQQVIDVDEAFRNRIYAIMRQRLLSSFLFGHPVFKNISKESRDKLSQALTIVEVARDEELFKAGDAAEHYYIVLSGEAEISVGTGKKKVVLEIRRDNHVLGEVRSDKGTKYAYTAQAANNLDLLLLDKKSMQLIHLIEPEVMARLNQVMGTQMKKTIAAIQNLPKS